MSSFNSSGRSVSLLWLAIRTCNWVSRHKDKGIADNWLRLQQPTTTKSYDHQRTITTAAD